MCTVDADGSAPGHLPQSNCPAATAVIFNMIVLSLSAGDKVTNSSIWMVWNVTPDIFHSRILYQSKKLSTYTHWLQILCEDLQTPKKVKFLV